MQQPFIPLSAEADSPLKGVFMAEALQRYLQQRRYTLDIRQDAAELKLRAERRAGEVLAAMEKDRGGNPRKNRSHRENGSFCYVLPTLRTSP